MHGMLDSAHPLVGGGPLSWMSTQGGRATNSEGAQEVEGALL